MNFRPIVLAGLLAASCTGRGLGSVTGSACDANEACAGQVCITDFNAGYCTSDCSGTPCNDGETCRAVGDNQLCFAACPTGGCRDGYMCFKGACVPSCASGDDCGKGFDCTDGTCVEHQGAAVGTPCKHDVECASQTCDLNTRRCQTPCRSDDDCAGGTCYDNPTDVNDDGSSDHLIPICIPLRNAANDVGAPCSLDEECRRGSCQLGLCTVMCDVNAQCTKAGYQCTSMVAKLDAAAPMTRACLPHIGVLDVNLGPGGSGPIGLPANAVGMNIYTAVAQNNIAVYVGVVQLVDPTGKELYAAPQTTAEFYNLTERYQVSEGTSMMLVPNSPAVRLGAGLWDFMTGVDRAANYTTRVRIKLGDWPPPPGHIPLHVLVGDLSGGCGRFDDTSKPAFESIIKTTFASANLTVDPITYKNVAVSGSITVVDGDISPQLDSLLQRATTGDDNDVLEAVLIKKIDSNSNNGEILGIAGGIPASTGVPGTPHSGIAFSLSSLCYAGGGSKGGRELGVTAAHELGHSMGLFHNIESDGHKSPMGDDVADGKNNLMYWAEDSVNQTHLSGNQSRVLLANPAVSQ